MKKQRIKKGFTFRHPGGALDWRTFEHVEAAQSAAAFASERPYSHIALPKDWTRAYKQGFRVVRCTLKAGAGSKAWAKLQKEPQ